MVEVQAFEENGGSYLNFENMEYVDEEDEGYGGERVNLW